MRIRIEKVRVHRNRKMNQKIEREMICFSLLHSPLFFPYYSLESLYPFTHSVQWMVRQFEFKHNIVQTHDSVISLRKNLIAWITTRRENIIYVCSRNKLYISYLKILFSSSLSFSSLSPHRLFFLLSHVCVISLITICSFVHHLIFITFNRIIPIVSTMPSFFLSLILFSFPSLINRRHVHFPFLAISNPCRFPHSTTHSFFTLSHH